MAKDPFISLPILGQSVATQNMIKMITRVATASTNVLVIGESGTGKELVARSIHDLSPLKGRPFVAVNCGAIPENLIESELFGHKRGSFTGAVSDKPGLFEVANGGTIFLDEVGDLPLSMQVKILRAIQDRSFRRVGGTEDVKVDIRIIAATNKNLEEGVKKGTFREDLYYRLNVILITTPPLRDRKDDIPILADAFLKKAVAKRGGTSSVKGFDQKVLAAFQAWTWPGNIRELENVVERAVTLESGEYISLQSVPVTISDVAHRLSIATDPEVTLPPGFQLILKPDFAKGPIHLDAALAYAHRLWVENAMQFTAGDHESAARLLSVEPSRFETHLELTGLKPPRSVPSSKGAASKRAGPSKSKAKPKASAKSKSKPKSR